MYWAQQFGDFRGSQGSSDSNYILGQHKAKLVPSPHPGPCCPWGALDGTASWWPKTLHSSGKAAEWEGAIPNYFLCIICPFQLSTGPPGPFYFPVSPLPFVCQLPLAWNVSPATPGGPNAHLRAD